MSLDRIEATLILGPPPGIIPLDRQNEAYSALAHRLTTLQGGVTYQIGKGLWATGAEHGDYQGPIEESDCGIYSLLMTVEESQAIIARAKIIVAQVVHEYGLPCNEIQLTLARVTRERLNIADQLSGWLEAGE